MFFLCLLMMMAVLLVAPAYAGGECNGHGNCDDESIVIDAGSSVIGGDTVIDTGGNKSLAVVAPGLGDVDIAQCLGSEAWSLLVGGKQKLVLNQVCMAEFYLKQGRYDLAAQSLCNQPEILDEYDTEVACEIAHDFTPIEPEGDELSRSFDEHYQLEEQHTEDIVVVQMAQTSLEDRIEALEQKPAPRPRVAQAPPQRYTDAQFDAVWLALKGSDEDE